MKVKKRFARVIFFLLAIIFVIYVGMKVVSGIMNAQNSNAELCPFTHSFPPEDSTLFAKKYLNKIEVDEIAHIYLGEARYPFFLLKRKRKLLFIGLIY